MLAPPDLGGAAWLPGVSQARSRWAVSDQQEKTPLTVTWLPLPPGYLWNLQVKLPPIVNLLPDKGRLMDFLLQRKECKMVILAVCSQSKGAPSCRPCPARAPVPRPVCSLWPTLHSEGG